MQSRPGRARASNYREIALIPYENPRVAVDKRSRTRFALFHGELTPVRPLSYEAALLRDCSHRESSNRFPSLSLSLC